MVATIFVRRMSFRQVSHAPPKRDPGPPHRLRGSMSPTVIFLGLLAAFLGLRVLKRLGAPRARPIFGQSEIYPARLAEGLLHALISDRGYLRADTPDRRGGGQRRRGGAGGRLRAPGPVPRPGLWAGRTTFPG